MSVAPIYSGCSQIHYYSQAISGHTDILTNREPVESLLETKDTPIVLKDKLEYALLARKFAEKELLLPAGGCYQSYVELDRKYVVWNVFAAPEFSLMPKKWCFPVAGCVSYKGYFSEGDANHFADKLAREGYDVYVAGVTAYSTLGWFDDPLLSSFVDRYSKERIAALIFHELAHRKLYIKGDTAFNESFASLIERVGFKKWLSTIDPKNDFKNYRTRLIYHEQFVGLVKKYRQRLQALYESDHEPVEMRSLKMNIIADLINAYGQLGQEWGGYRGYDHWFKEPINNAKILTVSAYNDFIPALKKILASVDGDLEKFYEICSRLTEMQIEERHNYLKSLTGSNN